MDFFLSQYYQNQKKNTAKNPDKCDIECEEGNPKKKINYRILSGKLMKNV